MTERSPLARSLEAWAEDAKERFNLASLAIFECTNGDIELMMISVNERKQGHGSAAMRSLCDFADEHGRRILVTPGHRDPNFRTTSRARLVRFYKRFGFVENRGRNKDFTTMCGLYRIPLRRRATEAPAANPGPHKAGS